jgi:hypothetical protein
MGNTPAQKAQKRLLKFQSVHGGIPPHRYRWLNFLAGIKKPRRSGVRYRCNGVNVNPDESSINERPNSVTSCHSIQGVVISLNVLPRSSHGF